MVWLAALSAGVVPILHPLLQIMGPSDTVPSTRGGCVSDLISLRSPYKSFWQPPQYYLQFLEHGSHSWPGEAGRGGEWSREMLHCSGLLWLSSFPFRRIGCIKEPQRWDESKPRTTRTDRLPSWGYYSLVLDCCIVLTFFIENMWAGGNDVWEMWEKELDSWAVTKTVLE